MVNEYVFDVSTTWAIVNSEEIRGYWEGKGTSFNSLI